MVISYAGGAVFGTVVGVAVAPTGVLVGVAVGPVGVLVGVAVAPTGVLVGVAVGLTPPPDGPGMAALSSITSSTVTSTAFELVTPVACSSKKARSHSTRSGVRLARYLAPEIPETLRRGEETAAMLHTRLELLAQRGETSAQTLLAELNTADAPEQHLAISKSTYYRQRQVASTQLLALLTQKHATHA